MMPIRASIVGPPRTARSNASIAVCHSVAVCSAFGSFAMYRPASLRVTSSRPFPRGPRGRMMIGSSIFASNRRRLSSIQIEFVAQLSCELCRLLWSNARAVHCKGRLPICMMISRFDGRDSCNVHHVTPVRMLTNLSHAHPPVVSLRKAPALFGDPGLFSQDTRRPYIFFSSIIGFFIM
jgi:hypothetical protein